jgi:hypothetical protein
VARTVMNSPVTSSASKAQSAAPAQQHDDRSAPGAGSGEAGSPNSAPEVRSNAESGQYAIARSGTDYRESTLGTQVAAELRSGRHLAGRPTGLPMQRLTACVRRIAPDRQPLLVDVAGYEGRPATIIALPGDAAGRMDIWVVGPNCSATADDVIEHTVS